MPDLSIVMPCYNRAHDLIRTLRAYDRQDGEGSFELIAVDDASNDTTHQVLASYRPERYRLRVERMARNSGPAAARNRGLELVEAPLVLIVGDDILPATGLVQGHLVAHRHHRAPQEAILGRVSWPEDLPVNTLMAHIDGTGAQQFSYHYMRDGQEYDFRHFYTANISIKRDFLGAVDRWFDTDFTHAAFEDTELAYRMARRGLRIVYAAQLRGYHYHAHNIWSFTQRQRNTGRMARMLTAKHPDLRYAFRAQYLRTANLFRQTRALLSPAPNAALERLEMFTCRLAGFYEWHPNRLLDRLYLAVLDYFYYDGFIQAFFRSANMVRRLRSAHAGRYLIPALRSFLVDARELGVDVPEGSSLDHLERLTRQLSR